MTTFALERFTVHAALIMVYDWFTATETKKIVVIVYQCVIVEEHVQCL
jgi:hypothetical protein